MKILVTGAGGYIGLPTIGVLSSIGHDVVGIDKIASPDVQPINLNDYNKMVKLFRSEGFEAVVHLAAMKTVNNNIAMEHYVTDNTLATDHLLQMCRRFGVKNIVFTSTAAVYGDHGRNRSAECGPINPISNYGLTKWECEQELMRFCSDTAGSAGVTLRLFNVMGGKTPSNGSLMAKLLDFYHGSIHSIPIYGTGQEERDFVHLRDVIMSFELALRWCSSHTGYLTTNIGSGMTTTVDDYIAMFGKVSEWQIATARMPRKPGSVDFSLAMIKAAEHHLGWTPHVSVLTSMQEAFAMSERRS